VTANRSQPATDRVDGRSDHKEQTRQALIDAALTLFAAKGYEATSVEDITSWAGVSPRTFFRYFETKDRVLFFGGDAFNHAVVRALPEQPPELDDLSALAATLRSLTALVVPLKPRIRLYFRAVEESVTLLGQHARSTAEHNEEVAAALAARRLLPAPDDDCRLAAELAAVALSRTYSAWLGSRRDLGALMDESFAALRSVAARAGAQAAP
jgi:AcrR family transcriptional regulator